MTYANKEKRNELSDLSKKVFGTRSKWQFFVKERGYSIEGIEQQMNLLSVEIDRIKTEELSNDNQGTTDGNNRDRQNNRPSIKITRQQRRIIERSRAKRQRKASRTQVRSEQTGSVDASTGSVDRNNKGS